MSLDFTFNIDRIDSQSYVMSVTYRAADDSLSLAPYHMPYIPLEESVVDRFSSGELTIEQVRAVVRQEVVRASYSAQRAWQIALRARVQPLPPQIEDLAYNGQWEPVSASEYQASVEGAPIALVDQKGMAKSNLDEAAGRARARFISGGAAIESEYQLALTEAKDFQTNGGEPPASVASHAIAYGVDHPTAAAQIIQTANQWFALLGQIRTLRLIGKAEIDVAESSEQVAQIETSYLSQLDMIRPENLGQ